MTETNADQKSLFIREMWHPPAYPSHILFPKFLIKAGLSPTQAMVVGILIYSEDQAPIKSSRLLEVLSGLGISLEEMQACLQGLQDKNCLILDDQSTYYLDWEVLTKLCIQNQ